MTRTYIYVVSKKLKWEDGRFSTDVSVRYMRLDAKDTSKILLRHSWRGKETSRAEEGRNGAEQFSRPGKARIRALVYVSRVS